MKKSLYIMVPIMLLLSACNDNFLEKYPLEKQTESTAFKSYSNFKTYAWGLYDVFNSGNILRKPGTTSEDGGYEGDVLAGYLSKKGDSYLNSYSFQLATVPSSGGGWDFSFIRRVNLMLANIDKSEMVQTDKDHWRSVGYFFRSFYYMELIARFGDVPWIDKVITEEDTDLIYGKRTPRDEVAKKVLDDLLWAEQHIKSSGDGKNTINVHCVRALISRFGLFEGTWRKYHQLGGGDSYLTECVRASELLMTNFTTLHPYYDELFTSPDLSVVNGVILYKEQIAAVLTSNNGHYERTSSNSNQMNKATVEMYLCTDGKPIATSDLYAGDKSLYNEFRNRDPRLLMVVAPPYKVKADGTPTGVAADVEYIDKMKQISREGHKRLPLYNWSGSLLECIPNVEPSPAKAFLACRTGYYMYKHYNTWDVNSNLQSLNTADKPLFKIEEVLLNYAEAKYELGQFDQAVADKSINKLRSRQNVSVAPMVIASITENFDPGRDPRVAPLLWEIRRERIVELMGEGFGFYDVRRWKCADWFLNKQVKGIYAKKSDYKMGNKIFWDPATKGPNSSLSEGYIYVSPDPQLSGKGWLNKYYLYPIPSGQLLLNSQLEQNPDWGKY